MWTVQFILALIALILTVISFIKPAWPILGVAVLLLSVAVLASWYKP